MVLGAARKGIKVTYCTDSRPTESIVQSARGSDLFICEGMYAEKEKLVKAKQYKHMTFYEAAEMASDSVLEGIFFRAGKLMFSSTKTTPPMATRPHGKRQVRITALKNRTV